MSFGFNLLSGSLVRLGLALPWQTDSLCLDLFRNKQGSLYLNANLRLNLSLARKKSEMTRM